MTTENYAGIDPILRWPDIKKITGLGRSTIHNLASKGLFPKPIKLSANGRASGWVSSEVQQWLKSRQAERDGKRLTA